MKIRSDEEEKVTMGCGFSNNSSVIGDPRSPEFQGNVHSFTHGRIGEKVRKSLGKFE